jgi:hypothetical protein
VLFVQLLLTLFLHNLRVRLTAFVVPDYSCLRSFIPSVAVSDTQSKHLLVAMQQQQASCDTATTSIKHGFNIRRVPITATVEYISCTATIKVALWLTAATTLSCAVGCALLSKCTHFITYNLLSSSPILCCMVRSTNTTLCTCLKAVLPEQWYY